MLLHRTCRHNNYSFPLPLNWVIKHNRMSVKYFYIFSHEKHFTNETDPHLNVIVTCHINGQHKTGTFGEISVASFDNGITNKTNYMASLVCETVTLVIRFRAHISDSSPFTHLPAARPLLSLTSPL